MIIEWLQRQGKVTIRNIVIKLYSYKELVLKVDVKLFQ